MMLVGKKQYIFVLSSPAIMSSELPLVLLSLGLQDFCLDNASVKMLAAILVLI